MRYEPMSAGRIGAIKRLWNAEWGETFPMREKVLEQNVLQDRNLVRTGTWLAVDEATDEVVGFVAAKCWQDDGAGLDFGRETGWIHALIVAPPFRNRGIGSELLRRAENALREQGVRQVELGNDFHWRVFPGVPHANLSAHSWFEKRGYSKQSVVHDLFRDDGAGQQEPLPRLPGVQFRLLRQEEADRMVSFMRRCFPGRWEYQTIQYWERGGTGREFVIAESEGEIVGFCRINDSHSPILTQNVYWAPLFAEELGGIGPLGVDERFRGRGYGLAIVKAGIHFLHARGIRKTVIDMTTYVDFYGKLGYRTWRSYTRFLKHL